MYKIAETKCTCNACGNIWFFGKQDVDKNKKIVNENASNALLACSTCFLLYMFIPRRDVIDLTKCAKCGSKAVNTELVEHEIGTGGSGPSGGDSNGDDIIY